MGARDLFVLRRVTGNQFVHFGGSGRGAGWAGLIEVDAADEPPLAGAPAPARVDGIARGVIFVAHTDAAPRGFTLLCRRRGLRLAQVASAQVGVALTRDWC